MTIRFINEPFVHFIHNAKHIKLNAKLAYKLQFFLCKDFSQWIIWCVHNYSLGATGKLGGQLFFV